MVLRSFSKRPVLGSVKVLAVLITNFQYPKLQGRGWKSLLQGVAGADTGGCTSCTEDRRIFRSKFLQLVFQFS